MHTLVLSNRHSLDRDAVIAAANATGLCETYTMSGWRVPRELRGRKDVGLYAEPLFYEATCGDLDLALLDAAPDWLARCPIELVGRAVRAGCLAEARTGSFPAFVKACDDKLAGVVARVYERPEDLPDAPPKTTVLISEPVQFEIEVRLFCEHGTPLAGSTYWRAGEAWQVPLDDFKLADEVTEFAVAVFAQASDGLPPAYVLDVGRLQNGQWAVIEANGAWGAGLYATPADRALPCILHSTIPRAESAALPTEVRREPPPAEW